MGRAGEESRCAQPLFCRGGDLGGILGAPPRPLSCPPCWQGAWCGHRQWQVVKGHRAWALLPSSISATLVTVLKCRAPVAFTWSLLPKSRGSVTRFLMATDAIPCKDWPGRSDRLKGGSARQEPACDPRGSHKPKSALPTPPHPNVLAQTITEAA